MSVLAGIERRRPAGPGEMAWLAAYPARQWRSLSLVVVLIVFKIGFDLLMPWPMKIVVDNVLHGQPLPVWLGDTLQALPGGAEPRSILVWAVLATVVLFVGAALLRLGRAIADVRLGQRMVYDLATDIFGRLQQQSLRYHLRRPVGDSLRRITTDSRCVSVIVKDALMPAVASVLSLAAMFAVMWQLDQVLAVASVVIVPLIVLGFRRYAGPMLERSYEQQDADGRIYEVVEETLGSLPVVQAFGQEERGDRRLARATGETLRRTVAMTDVQLRFKIVVGLATAIGTAAVLWLGGRHVLEGTLTVGTVLVFLSYLSSLYGLIASVAYAPSAIQEAAGSARRVMEVLHAEPEVADRPGATALGAVRGELRIDEVTVGYEPERPVLHEVTLEARPGETLAIVGATGAGKSTLVSLVPRFLDPWRGRVTLDGHDLRDIQLRSLREHIAIVLQEPFLFPVSVAENICYGRPEATAAEIEQAARAANAHAFIERLPDGYGTVLGERGATLSGGERQRLSIARALLKDAPILILDEPTSALDAETEALLVEALERLMAGRTTLIIAHRLSTIRRADRIVVLDAGRIVESGRPAELLARGGRYAHLHRLQAGEPLAAAVAS